MKKLLIIIILVAIFPGIAQATVPAWPDIPPYIAGYTYNPNTALVAPTGIGTTKYVATTGNDTTGDGSINNPWLTIQHGVDNGLVNPGDRLLIRGGLYRECVDVTASGSTQANPFIISAYGGETVVIDGSTAVTGWSNYSGNIWSVSVPSFTPFNVIINWKIMYRELSLAALEADPADSTVPPEQRYFWDSTGKVLYVRTDQGDPTNQDVGVVNYDKSTDSHRQCLFISSDYYYIYGLTCRFAPSRGILLYPCSHAKIENCRVFYNGYDGIRSGSGSDYSTILNNFLYGNGFCDWPYLRTFHSQGWGAGIAVAGPGHNTVQGNVVQCTSGEAINCNGGTGYNTMKWNVCTEAESYLLYSDSESYDVIDSNFAIGITPKSNNFYNNQVAFNSGIFRATRGVVGLGQEGSNTTNLTIINNVITNCRGALSMTGSQGSGWQYVTYANNTVITPKTLYVDHDNLGFSENVTFIDGIRLEWYAGNIGNVIRNNVFIHGGLAGQHLLTYVCPNTEMGTENLFKGFSFGYNCLVSSGNVFLWGNNYGTEYNYANWAALTDNEDSHGSNNVTTDPSLPDPWGTSLANFQQGSGSSINDCGVTISAVSKDFLGLSRPSGSAYDMGAFEYQQGFPAGTPLIMMH